MPEKRAPCKTRISNERKPFQSAREIDSQFSGIFSRTCERKHNRRSVTTNNTQDDIPRVPNAIVSQTPLSTTRMPTSIRIRRTAVAFWPQFRPASRLFLCIVTAIILSLVSGDNNSNSAVFHFPEYDYKETSKNELSYREFESACEQSSRCEQIAPGLTRTRCVRECISPSCYQDIYRFDELEDGEIDVRLISFKGCFVQRSGRSRNR